MEQNHGRILAAELFGTAVLVIVGVGTAVLAPQAGLLALSLAFGLTYTAMLHVVGPITSCYLNPAITLAQVVAKQISGVHAVFAVIGQVVGALVGATVVVGVASGRDAFDRADFASNRWSGPYGGLGATIVVEVVLTAVLVVVALTLHARRRTLAGATTGPLVLGFTLAALHLVSGPVDNTGLNPARSIGSAVFATLDSGALEQLWAFVVFPLVGAIMGVVLWLVIDDSRVEDTLLGAIPGVTEVRDALDDASDRAVDAVEDVVD